MDDKIEKLNSKISKLLGKKGNNKPNLRGSNDDDMISDAIYIIITLLCFLLLWLSTCIYYVNDKFFGLVLSNGKLQQVISGPKVGITYPVPFGSVEMVNASVSDMLDISADGSSDINYKALTLDAIAIGTSAQFSYQIVNPQKLYNKISLQQENIENTVKLDVAASFHNYISRESYASIRDANLTIVGNQIRDMVNKDLYSYGLLVVKININKLTIIDDSGLSKKTSGVLEQANLPQNGLEMQLINQAYLYQIDQLTFAESDIAIYNKLLYQYKQNPKLVVEQIYNDAISSVGVVKPVTISEKYPLLFKSLADLNQMMAQSSFTVSGESNISDIRDIVRDRVWGR